MRSLNASAPEIAKGALKNLIHRAVEHRCQFTSFSISFKKTYAICLLLYKKKRGRRRLIKLLFNGVYRLFCRLQPYFECFAQSMEGQQPVR